MDREAWLKWRSQGIGASDAPIIMNLAPAHWKINSPYKLWLNRMGQLENEINAAMERGNQYEEEALGWFQKEVGVCLFSQQCYEHKEKPWMRCTLDGIDIDEQISVELKVSSKENFELVKSGKIPPLYMPQLLHQMEVKPTKHHFFCVYLPMYREGVFIEVVKDEVYLKEIMEKEEEVWKCIQKKIPPEFTERDFIDRTSDDIWMSKARTVAELRQQLRELEKQEKQEWQELLDLSDGKSSIGGGFKLIQYTISGRVDYKRIPELKNIDLDLYKKAPSIAYRLVTNQ